MAAFLTIVGWIMALIFAYLLFNNYKGATSIENATFSGSKGLITVLQGR